MAFDIQMEELVSRGAHIGHLRKFSNPKMAPYKYMTHQGVDLLDLNQTQDALIQACEFVSNMVSQNKTLLFVGTKRVASGIIREQAESASMPYINNRWLGGTMTNWKTIKASINQYKLFEEQIARGDIEASDGNTVTSTKMELLRKQRQVDKMRLNLEGIRDMNGPPDALFVVDIQREHIAVAEARKMGSTVIALVDSNSDPSKVDMVIPMNDDSRKVIEYATALIAQACIEGREKAKNFGSGHRGKSSR